MNKNFTRKSLPLAVLLASGLVATSVAAQLEEVVVTAQKREQSLQDTPIAITAFDKGDIDARRISDVQDLAQFAPNVQIAPSPGGGTGATIAIRGASTINPAITWEPVVGLYLDGVFLGKNLGGIFDIAELERVEVLRGPQGTLYGKNTVGGAINMITRLPGDEFGGQVDVSVGNEGYTQGKLRIDTGAVGMFRASAAYFKAERDGFYDNIDSDPTGGQNPFVNSRSSSEFSNLDSEVWRADIVADFSDSFRARYVYDHSERKQQPSKGQLTDVSAAAFEGFGVGFLAPLLDLYTSSDSDNTGAISNDFSQFENSETEGHALFLDYDAGTWGALGDVQFKSITSLRELDWEDRLDIDGSPMNLFTSGRDVDYEQFSQEFQIVGTTDTVNYVLGLYYFEEEADVFNPISFFGLFGGPADDNEYGIDSESIALYGQAEWSPASMERLSVTLGLRYTEEDKDQYITHPNASGSGSTFDVEDSDSWDNTSSSLIVAYELADDVNVYGKVAQGWKSGGFNGEAPTADAFREGYDAEEVMAFEVGVKSRFADGKIQLNAAVFYNEISDMQVSVFLEGSGGAASNVANAGEATFQGLELEMSWQLAESVVLSANYGYLDVEYDEFIEDGVDVKDAKDVPYAPENTMSVSLDWSLGNVGFGDLDLHIDWNFNDDYVPYINPDQNATSMIDSYDILNASLILSEVSVGSHSSLQFSLWGKNITDEEYRQNTIPFGLWTISYFGQPATYGFDARLNF